MKKLFLLRISVFIVILMINGSCGESPNYLYIYDLRCENLVQPLGIDTTIPHFSWKLSSDRNGVNQKAYRIMVASDSLMLVEGKADLWNSGKVNSPASVMVRYNGKALQARSLAYWKIGVWDQNSSQPVWSGISFSASVCCRRPTGQALISVYLAKKETLNVR